MKKIIFMLLFQMSCYFVISAEDGSFFKIVHNENDKIDIVLNIHDSHISNVELYRVLRKSDPVNIYEFVVPENSFSGPSVIGACYFLKIYYDNGTVRETGRKCHSEADVLKNINLSMVLVLFLFLLSVGIAGFIKKPFFYSISRDKQSMLKFIVTLLGENTAKISFLNSVDSTGHPLRGPLTALMKGLANSTDTGSSIESEFFSDGSDSFLQTGKNTFVTMPSFRDLAGFYSAVNRKDWSRQMVFNVSDGSAVSDWSIYFAGENKRNINLSLNVPGLSGNAVLSRKNLISIEPFLLSSQLESIKSGRSLKVSGAYLFLIVVAVILTAGSLLSTLAYYFPFIAELINSPGVR
ncbi:MAG TPA: hypothetical protein VLJ60_06990 [bacterium]|nr:hypothetical protein [bacterium]